MGLEGNVRIRREGKNNLIALPRWFEQLSAEELGRIYFGDNLPIKVGPGSIPEIFMSRPAEAVGAAVNAASIAVERVIKAHIRTVVVAYDRAGSCLFKDFEPGFGRFTQPLDGMS